MSKIAYVNGVYAPASDAGVHIEDRGFQFADGVYEVCLLVGGALWDEAGHLARLDRSLEELSIEQPMSRQAMKQVIAALIRKNRLHDALIYIQVTRGSCPRNHVFPDKPVDPSLVMTMKAFDFEKSCETAAHGVSVVTAPDIRWGRADIKSVSLLPNVLAKEAAKQEGAAEAWLVRDGKITEGASSNAWIINSAGELVTHPLGNEILGGITRQAVIECAEELQLKIVEQPFTEEDALNASEAFLTSATNLVMPVVKIDGKKIGNGMPGEVVPRLRKAYIQRCMAN